MKDMWKSHSVGFWCHLVRDFPTAKSSRCLSQKHQQRPTKLQYSQGSTHFNTERQFGALHLQVKPLFSYSLHVCLYSITNRLASRLQHGEDTISFDKDDDDTLDFVTASSNLRLYAYGIETKTRWEAKGSIFPSWLSWCWPDGFRNGRIYHFYDFLWSICLRIRTRSYEMSTFNSNPLFLSAQSS